MPDKDDVSIGDLLRQGRAARNLTQTSAAEAIGVTQGTWSSWERGDGAPSDENLVAIAGALDLPLDNLNAAKAKSVTPRRYGYIDVPLGRAAGTFGAEPINEFVTRSLRVARTELGKDLSIYLVGPEVLPFVDHEDIQKEWCDGVIAGASYNLVWFADALLFNQRPDSAYYGNRLKDIRKALAGLREMIRESLSDPDGVDESRLPFEIRHVFLWSGLFDEEVEDDPALLGESSASGEFEPSIPLKRVAMFIHLLSNESDEGILSNSVALVHGGDATSSKGDIMEWLLSECKPLGKPREYDQQQMIDLSSPHTSPINAKLALRRITANISARFWNNRDLLAVYADKAGLEIPMGYNIPRRGYRDFTIAMRSDQPVEESVPRILDPQEAFRLHAQMKKITDGSLPLKSISPPGDR